MVANAVFRGRSRPGPGVVTHATHTRRREAILSRLADWKYGPPSPPPCVQAHVQLTWRVGASWVRLPALCFSAETDPDHDSVENTVAALSKHASVIRVRPACSRSGSPLFLFLYPQLNPPPPPPPRLRDTDALQVENCGRLVTLEKPRRLLQPLLLFLLGAGIHPGELTAVHNKLIEHELPGDPQTVHYEGDGATYQVYL